MTEAFSEVSEIKKICSPAVGEKARGTSLVGNGNHIGFNFGDAQPIEWDLSQTRGKWNLFINHCEWRLEKAGIILTGSEDYRSRIDPAIQHINGKTLIDIDIHWPTLDTNFIFSDQLVLRLFRASALDKRGAYWTFRLPENGQVLEIGPGVTWSIKVYTYDTRKSTRDT